MWKKISTVGAVAALALAVSSCGNSSEADEGDGGKPYVAIVSKGFQQQFWQYVLQGAQKAAKEYGARITFEGPESETDVDEQVQMLQTALSRDPDAIGYAALDSQASIPLMTQAESADIPVVAFDSGVESDVPVTTVATDNKAAAALAAKHMAEEIGGKGQVALVVHDQTSVSGIDRRDGFVQYMKQNHPGIEIVDIQYGGGDPLESTDVAKSILQANPGLDGIFGANEGSAIGVVNAVQELNKEGDLSVVGFDSGAEQINAVKSGLMTGAITQDPDDIGYQTVKAALAVIDGKDVPEVIHTNYYWYDRSNLDEPQIESALYK
jgi:ribose transport system substrate-binding protein